MHFKLTDIANDIDSLKVAQATAKAKFKVTIKDESIPLDERWKFFKKAPGWLKDDENYGPSLSSLDGKRNISYYDDFYMERHSTWSYVSIIERLEDNMGGWKRSMEDFNDQANIDLVKEEILAGNKGNFTFDW